MSKRRAEDGRAKGSDKDEVIYLLFERERERESMGRVILDRTTVTHLAKHLTHR
jgi:hypothetical protein